MYCIVFLLRMPLLKLLSVPILILPLTNDKLLQERDDLINPFWIEDRDLGRGEVDYLSGAEIQFWKDLIEKYLHPLDDDKVKKVKFYVQQEKCIYFKRRFLKQLKFRRTSHATNLIFATTTTILDLEYVPLFL